MNQAKTLARVPWYRNGWNLLALLPASVGIYGIGSLLRWDWLSSANTPSWVQAIGSIVALVFAFWYPERRIALQTEDHVRHQVKRMWTLSMSMNMTFNSVCVPYINGTVPNCPHIDPATLEHWLHRLRGIDETALSDKQMQIYFALDRCVRTVASRLSQDSVARLTVQEMYSFMEQFFKGAHMPINSERGRLERRQ